MKSTFLVLPKSLSAKIFFFLIVAMVCLVFIFNVVLIRIQKKAYKSSYDTYGATLIRLVAHSVSLGVYTEDKEQMYAPVSGLLQQDDVFEVVIWNKEKKVLLEKVKDSNKKLRIPGEFMKMPKGLIHYYQHDHIDNSGYLRTETKKHFILWGRVFSPIIDESWYFDGENNNAEKEITGYMAIVLSKDSFEKGVRNILVQTGVSGLIFLFVIILATFIVIQSVTEPLRKLVLTIRNRDGITEQPSDLKVLTDTYASMIDDLEQSFQTISELNQVLEEKVIYRTLQLTKANNKLQRRQEKLKISNAELVEALRQLRETQEQLIQKEKLAAMGQLVAGVAHELNNTVNFISGALPSLHRMLDKVKDVLAGYEEVEKARGSDKLDETFEKVRVLKEEIFYQDLFSFIDQLMENIEEGTRRTTGIVRDLKVFSRQDVEKIIVVDVHKIIDSTINYVDKQLVKNITIHRDYGSLPLVYCLPGRIGQVFLNIINNGIQAMDGEGRLTIKTKYQDEQVYMSFSDTGCGIPPNVIPKIFDPFFTSKEVGKGTGLGLGISYTIVRQHGGDIKVQSEVDNGSVFTIILPVRPVEISEDKVV